MSKIIDEELNMVYGAKDIFPLKNETVERPPQEADRPPFPPEVGRPPFPPADVQPFPPMK